MTSKTTKVCIPDYDTRPSIYFIFYVDCFLYHFFETSRDLAILLYFDLEEGFKVFLKIANYSWFIWGPNNIQFY